jgi:hypothetical protein
LSTGLRPSTNRRPRPILRRLFHSPRNNLRKKWSCLHFICIRLGPRVRCLSLSEPFRMCRARNACHSARISVSPAFSTDRMLQSDNVSLLSDFQGTPKLSHGHTNLSCRRHDLVKETVEIGWVDPITACRRSFMFAATQVSISVISHPL